MKIYRYLLVSCLFLVCLVSVGQEPELVPFLEKIGGQWGFKNPTTGEIVIRPQFDGTNKFQEGFASVQIGNKWGFINTTGQVIVDPIYDEVKGFYKSLAGVRLGGRWGIVNSTGKVTLEPQFVMLDVIKPKIDQYIMVGQYPRTSIRYHYSYVLVNENSEIFHPMNFGNWYAGDVYVSFGKERKYGFINKIGDVIIEPIYDAVGVFQEG